MDKEQMKDEIILTVKFEIGASSLGDYGVTLDDNDVDHVAESVAESLIEKGYRKTFTSDLASNTQKAYKEGYDKGFLDGREEFDIILQQNKQLLQAREILKIDIERLKTQLQQANAGIVNCIGCHLVELNAVREFANKLKDKAVDFLYSATVDGHPGFDIHISELCHMIDELLKEYEK